MQGLLLRVKCYLFPKTEKQLRNPFLKYLVAAKLL